MNFDTFISMNGMSTSAGMLAGPVQTEAGLSLAPQDSEFADLLGLVGDLQIADEQEGVLDDVLNAELEGMTENSNLSLQGKLQNASGAVTPDYLENVTLLNKPTTVTNGLPLATGVSQAAITPSDIQLNSLENEGAKLLTEKRVDAPLVAQRSLEAWSVPLLSNDLKRVALKNRELSADEVKLNFLKSKPALSESILESGKIAGAEEAPLDLAQKGNFLKEAKLPVQQGALASSLKAVVGGADVSASLSEAAGETEASAALTSKPTLKSKESLVSSAPVATSFSELNLAMLSGKSELSSQGKVEQTFVQMPDKLMTNQDTRVGAEAVGFVSSQVDILKSKGGGEMVVNLQPVELGEIKIQVVRESSGHMKVTLSAAKESTAKIFANSEKDLQSALDGHGAKLEIAKFKAVDSVASSKVSSEKSFEGASTENFLQNYKTNTQAVSESALNKAQKGTFERAASDGLKSVVGGENLRATSGSSFDLSSNNSSEQEGFHRERKQDSENQKEAYKKWQDSLDERKLA